MRTMFEAAGFTDVKIAVKENGADIISGWMPGSGAEEFVTSAAVTATKPLVGMSLRDAVTTRVEGQPVATQSTDCCPPVVIEGAGDDSAGC
mmetsp:Transcript_11629/g.15363  ORF Transcript_11629/g.15363 Transcript_11629/m.15363 type:complete len:91 (+) Transcript_11629:889-1161(+)